MRSDLFISDFPEPQFAVSGNPGIRISEMLAWVRNIILPKISYPVGYVDCSLDVLELTQIVVKRRDCYVMSK